MNPEIVVIGNQSTTLNRRQADEARCYLSYIGNFCGANADDNKGCGKTVLELETLYKAELIKQGKKICECDTIYSKKTLQSVLNAMV